MFTTTSRRRQFSLKTIVHPASKTTTGFHPQKLLPTIQENREAKKNNAKDLSQAISKFQNNRSKVEKQKSEDMLRSTVNVIKAFGLVEHNFQKLFEDLYPILKRFCFAVDDPEISTILSEYRIPEGSSFRKTVISMNEELGNIMLTKNNSIKELTESIGKLKVKYGEKQIEWGQQKKNMENEIERLKKLANIEYMESLQELVERQKTEISELKAQNTHLLKQNDEFLKQIDNKDNTIHNLSYEVAQLKTEVFDISKKLDLVDNYFSVLKDRFDGLMMKMMGLKEVISKVEQQNETLVSERASLVNRASVSFNDLTPRPKYKEIFNISERASLNSTVDIFAKVMEGSNLNHKHVIDKILIRKKNYKLQQAESIREKVVEDIIESKQKMRKLQKPI